VVASVDPELKAKGQASFVIGAETPGLEQGSKIHKTGIRASHTAEVVLDNVRIPVSQVLGGKKALDARLATARSGKSSGGQPAMATFEMSRAYVGAMAVGIARGAFEYALKYAQERVQFGKPIIEHQLIAQKIANMSTEIDSARLLVWRALWMARNGKPLTKGEGSMAKLKASEVAVDVTRQAIQILGGAGFTTDHPVERMHRDSLVFTIFEGTSEIQQLIIASALAGRRIR
jgi:alkylation response protein AidB-like acyl-CoA dehydrogenase